MSDLPAPPSPEEIPFPDGSNIPPPVEGEVHEADVLKRRKHFSWKQFGGDGFLVSVAFHVILLLLALFYVIKKYTEPKKPDTEVFATGSGGGASGDKAKIFEHRMQRKISTPLKSPARIVSKGASSVSLPSVPTTSSASFASGLSAGGMSKGAGGGSGGGIGTGQGIGVGGGRNLVTLFGSVNNRGDALEGTLYDLKHDTNGKARYDGANMNERVKSMHEAIDLLVRTHFKKTAFDEKYFKAPKQLYSTSFMIPHIRAELATSDKGFDCADVIQAPGWLAYYEGWITPPETDEYRFCGMGDDMLLVAVDDKPALWAAWPQGGMQSWVKPGRDWEPARAYKSGIDDPGGSGRFFGGWFTLQKGRRYRVVVVLSECYGGLFSSKIGIQKKKTNGEKSPAPGEPMFVFQLAKPETPSTGQYTTEGAPVFGLEANGMKAPPKFVR